MLYKIVYISGPMKGIPELNYPLFNNVQARLEEAGYIVNNPATNVVDEELFTGDALYKEYMRLSVLQVANSECLCMLPGWEASKGATFEKAIADMCGLPVCELSHEEVEQDGMIVLEWDADNDI